MNTKSNGESNSDTELVEKLYQPFTAWPKLESSVISLPDKYQIDISYLIKALEDVRLKYSLQPIIIDPITKKKRLTYRGIGLTSRKASKDPIYEGAQYYNSSGELVSSAKYDDESTDSSKTVSFENEFSEINNVAPDLVLKIKSLFDKWTVTKVRLMELHPGGRIPPHHDHPYYDQIRIHYLIETNPDVYWNVEGVNFKMEANGKPFWFDTGRIHSVYNKGSTPRTVLSIHLKAPADKEATLNFIQDLRSGLL